jgi:hypothetical protein
MHGGDRAGDRHDDTTSNPQASSGGFRGVVPPGNSRGGFRGVVPPGNSRGGFRGVVSPGNSRRRFRRFLPAGHSRTRFRRFLPAGRSRARFRAIGVWALGSAVSAAEQGRGRHRAPPAGSRAEPGRSCPGGPRPRWYAARGRRSREDGPLWPATRRRPASAARRRAGRRHCTPEYSTGSDATKGPVSAARTAPTAARGGSPR